MEENYQEVIFSKYFIIINAPKNLNKFQLFEYGDMVLISGEKCKNGQLIKAFFQGNFCLNVDGEMKPGEAIYFHNGMMCKNWYGGKLCGFAIKEMSRGIWKCLFLNSFSPKETIAPNYYREEIEPQNDREIEE